VLEGKERKNGRKKTRRRTDSVEGTGVEGGNESVAQVKKDANL